MNCIDIKKKLEVYIDNELEAQEKLAIQQHLERCADCKTEYELLTSINSIGEMDTLEEPSPEYWKQLNQDIHHKINKLNPKPSIFSTMVEKIRNFIWPDSIGFRLVAVAASAAIIFFIVRLADFDYKKAETPAEFLQNQIKESLSEKKSEIQIFYSFIQTTPSALKNHHKLLVSIFLFYTHQILLFHFF